MAVDFDKYPFNHYSEDIHTLERCIENRRKILLDFIEKIGRIILKDLIK